LPGVAVLQDVLSQQKYDLVRCDFVDWTFLVSRREYSRPWPGMESIGYVNL